MTQHPFWFIHQYIADIVVYAFRTQFGTLCSSQMADSPPQPPPPADMFAPHSLVSAGPHQAFPTAIMASSAPWDPQNSGHHNTQPQVFRGSGVKLEVAAGVVAGYGGLRQRRR